jgi:hypothetical protein
MKRIALMFAALCLAVPLFAADAARDGSEGTTEREVPRISESQRRPSDVASLDEVKCGYHPDLPSNCLYKCRNGVPVYNADGTQRVLCYNTPEYPCNRYYSCNGFECNFNNNWESACEFIFGTNACTSCDPL